MTALIALAETAGFDPRFGARLPESATDLGLQGIGGTRHQVLVQGGTARIKLYANSIEETANRLITSGALDRDDISRAAELFANPEFWVYSTLVVSVWGAVHET